MPIPETTPLDMASLKGLFMPIVWAMVAFEFLVASFIVAAVRIVSSLPLPPFFLALVAEVIPVILAKSVRLFASEARALPPVVLLKAATVIDESLILLST